MKIYTRTGDTGRTSLASGERVRKGDARLSVIGTLDELSAHLGLLLTEDLSKEDAQLLRRAQSLTLAAGAIAAEASPTVIKNLKKPLTTTDVKKLEGRIDTLEKTLAPLKNFILPGGTRAAAQAQLARAIVRRFEREWQRVPTERKVWRSYWNRLSDYLFVLARVLNHRAGISDIIWNT